MITVLALAVASVAATRGMWSPCGLSMLSSLNPVSEAARGNRYWLTALWYVLGAAVGGALLGGGLAVAAFGFGRLGAGASWSWGLALAAAAVAVVSDSTLVAFALPDHPRQVDERWLVAFRRWIYAGGFGVQIGAGFATYIMTAGVYLAAALAVLTASPASAFAVGLAFGVVRGLGVLLTARARTPQQLRALMARVDALGPASLRAACAVSAAAGLVAAWALAGPVLAAVLAVPFALLVAGRRAGRAVAVG